MGNIIKPENFTHHAKLIGTLAFAISKFPHFSDVQAEASETNAALMKAVSSLEALLDLLEGA
jgi:hypothetical protein